MKKYLLPSVFFIIFSLIIASIVLVFNGVKGEVNEKTNYKYALDNVFTSDVMSVVSEVSDNFIKPYVDEKVSIQRYFYNKNSEMDKQEKSIIYYENTYIQNKGVDYTNSEPFDVVSICNGEVTNIEKSELYGNIITVKCNNIEIKYYNLSNVLFNVGNKVTQGEILGSTSLSKFDKNLYLLHFEILNNGKYIDPESIYSLKISSFN